jgi:hypothetical protein
MRLLVVAHRLEAYATLGKLIVGSTSYGQAEDIVAT